MQVLVVDDQAIMRRIIMKMVKKAGVEECREASSAAEALEILDTTSFDLILTDWNMPGMPGIDFIRVLRNRPDTKTTPIIMVTTHDSEDDVIEALKAGVSHYLTKPFKAHAITERVASILYPA